MPTLEERIEAHERRAEGERQLIRQLKADRKKREREKRREAERVARQRERDDALSFCRLLRSSFVIVNGEQVNAFEFVSSNIVPRLVDGDGVAINRDD